MLSIGLRAHDFGKGSVEEIASRISGKGAVCTQLALGKAIEGFSFTPGCMTPGLGHYIRRVLAEKGVHVAVFGCYFNVVDIDLEARRKSIERFKEHIRMARTMGCSLVGTETGSLNRDMSYNPLNHEEAALETVVDVMRELCDEAEKFGVIVGMEGVSKYTINNVERIKTVLDRVNSPNLQIIFDPVNLTNIDNYHDGSSAIIEKAFELFGEKIAVVHAKDYIVEEGQLKVVPPGKGLMNYELFLKKLKAYKPHIEILVEDLKPQDMDDALKFIKETYDKI
jgi:sugar phosphate isomerase/epimerase